MIQKIIISPKKLPQDFTQHSKLYERFMKIKQWKLLKPFMKKEKETSWHPKPKSFFIIFSIFNAGTSGQITTAFSEYNH